MSLIWLWKIEEGRKSDQYYTLESQILHEAGSHGSPMSRSRGRKISEELHSEHNENYPKPRGGNDITAMEKELEEIGNRQSMDINSKNLSQ